MSEQIPKTMKALVCHGPHDYRLDEIPVPEIGPEEILVKVKACGICAGMLSPGLALPCFGETTFSLSGTSRL